MPQMTGVVCVAMVWQGEVRTGVESGGVLSSDERSLDRYVINLPSDSRGSHAIYTRPYTCD